MAKGKARRTLLGIQGHVLQAQAPNWEFIYRASTIRDDQWNIGDIVELPDGREFHYAKSSAECASGQAVEYVAVGVQTYAVVLNAQVIGDKVLTITGGTHDAIAKDELRGGYVITWPGAKKDQFRGIIGNDVSAEDADIKIYLDGALTVALVAGSTGVEAFQNPFANVRTGSSSVKAKAGVPATYISGANIFFWVQTGGFGWLAPQADMITNKIGAYYRHDGSIQADQAFASLVAGEDTTQYAGNRVIGDKDNIGPLFLLK